MAQNDVPPCGRKYDPTGRGPLPERLGALRSRWVLFKFAISHGRSQIVREAVAAKKDLFRERHFVKKLSLSVFILTKQMTLCTRIVKVS